MWLLDSSRYKCPTRAECKACEPLRHEHIPFHILNIEDRLWDPKEDARVIR